MKRIGFQFLSFDWTVCSLQLCPWSGLETVGIRPTIGLIKLNVMVDSSGQEMGLHSNSRAEEIVAILLYFIIGRDLIKRDTSGSTGGQRTRDRTCTHGSTMCHPELNFQPKAAVLTRSLSREWSN